MKVVIDGVAYAPIPKVPKGVNKFLEIRFDSDAGDNLTVREYLQKLLLTLWDEREGFSGKRPFGNSSWEYELYEPLIQAGAIPGKLDEDGCVDDVDKKVADAYIAGLIMAAFSTKEQQP